MDPDSSTCGFSSYWFAVNLYCSKTNWQRDKPTTNFFCGSLPVVFLEDREDAKMTEVDGEQQVLLSDLIFFKILHIWSRATLYL